MRNGSLFYVYPFRRLIHFGHLWNHISYIELTDIFFLQIATPFSSTDYQKDTLKGDERKYILLKTDFYPVKNKNELCQNKNDTAHVE